MTKQQKNVTVEAAKNELLSIKTSNKIIEEVYLSVSYFSVGWYLLICKV